MPGAGPEAGGVVNKDTSRTFEAVLVRQCAPTLAGMKPGSIFCFNHSPLEVSRQKVCQWNKQLAPFGLAVQILLERPGSSSMIVYVYRRKHLEQILSDDAFRNFLAGAGYERANLDGLLEQLAQRLRTQPEFPHEIGVFLGYPLRDVIGFIENHGRNFTCCGFWKSYGDPAEMQVCFACYRRCIQTYVAMFEQGIPLERLAVPA